MTSNEHSNVFAIKCPICRNNGVVGFLDGAGYCQNKNCHNQTDYSAYQYCDYCSYSLKKCHVCGSAIKAGNLYKDELTKVISKEKSRWQGYYKNDPDYAGICVQLDKKLSEAISQFADKTFDEVVEICYVRPTDDSKDD